MKLKLDENLGKSPLTLFQAAGHDVETVASEGLSGATDEQVIETCRAEQRCLVTLDADFSNPLVFNPADYSGIAFLRLPNNPSPEDLLLACRTFIVALEMNTIDGKLWSIQRGRIREYRPDNADDE